MAFRHRRDEVSSVRVAAWASRLGPPTPESPRSRVMAHIGGVASVAALVLYVAWRITCTLPSGSGRTVAYLLVTFEALPLAGLVVKLITLWRIDAPAPQAHDGWTCEDRVVVLIPTYNEPLEVITPTIAASCRLQPHHETWVLDDGDRPWVAELCEGLGARYVTREIHDHAKAGNLNNALRILAEEEAAGVGGADIIAVLDCDHVPLPSFLSATLPWFADPTIALVQGPQAFYNAGAFDDDGYTGEQGLFFNVLMPSRHHAGAGPFWCGSTSLLRVSALRQVGGVATETITEDMHTTLKLIRAGWHTVYHHQSLAVGLAPDTSEQYLLQRRRWGMGAMQILHHERLWAARRWMSWRNYHEYLTGTLWWLEGIATLIAFAVPVAVLITGARTSTAPPLEFTGAFTAMFTTRLWGAKRLLRGEIHWPTAFALRILRVPVGMSCLWWLLTRQTLAFAVTPKGAADDRRRGRAPRIIWALTGIVVTVTAYAAAGVAGIVPWHTSTPSTVASGAWLVLAAVVLCMGLRRIRSPRYATSRRNAPRIPFTTPVTVDGVQAELVDISVGGAKVHVPSGWSAPARLVLLSLPGGFDLKMQAVAISRPNRNGVTMSLRVDDADWHTHARMTEWLFHTPHGIIPELPDGIPVAAATAVAHTSTNTPAPVRDSQGRHASRQAMAA